MPQAKPPPYWNEGARRLLAEFAGRRHRHADSRRMAARALLAEFAELTAKYKLPIKLDDPEGVSFPMSGDRGYIVVRRDGWLYLATEGEDEKRLPLNYDPVAEQFEGSEPDPDRVPEPGALLPRRSALTVLALAVMKNMSEDL